MPTEHEAKSIFLSAAELANPADREAFIAAQCGGNESLRREVDDLLRHEQSLGSFLESPAADLSPTVAEPALAERPGSLIGPYKLLQQIGEGGMGTVFMAEQSHPIQRTVALKIIKPGMDSRQVIARFEAERQALAMMDHPNIAKVLDAGVVGLASRVGLDANEGPARLAGPTGRPYFVMELVKGIPVTKYCDDHHLTLRQRLELFLPVCQAVQHAHQKGIIHRDLKPSNVLVAEYDSHAVPKVIDFGVAKATAQKLTDRTMFTEFGQIIGTVEYMSPEQAKFNQLDIDTRSDIYSLGVLLYELLTGSPPFERQRLREAALDEVLRIIREEDPPKPSTRIDSSEALPSIAASRQTEPIRLSKEVRGELDWIVMKCLEKDRSRRYETANGLVRDIQHFLRDEPVQACPPTFLYRVRKFVRRNKLAMLAASATFLVLLAGVAGLAVSNRLIAAQRQRAEQNFIRARVAVSKILTQATMGSGDWSQLTPALRKKFAHEAITFYESFLQEYSTDPALQYETAVAQRAIGDLHRSVKDIRSAESSLQQSIATLERLNDQYPDSLNYQQQLAYSYYTFGRVQLQARQVDEADASLAKATALYEKLIMQRPDEADYFTELAYCYGAIEALQKRHGSSKNAERAMKHVLGVLAQVQPSGTQSAAIQLKIAKIFMSVGQLDEAFKALEKAAHLVTPEDESQRRDIAGELVTLANRRINQPTADAAKGEAAARKAIELAPRHGMAYANLAVALRDQGRLEEAVAASRKGLELQPDYANGYFELGYFLHRLRKFDEAATACRKAIELEPSNVQTYDLLAHCLMDQKDLAGAVATWEKMIELEPKSPVARNNIAWFLAMAGDAKDRNPKLAVKFAKEAVAIAPSSAVYRNTLGVAQYRSGEWKAAIESLESSMALTAGGNAFDWLFLSMSNWQLGHKEEARKWFDRAVETPVKSIPQNNELNRIKAEAMDLLGISTSPRTKPANPNTTP